MKDQRLKAFTYKCKCGYILNVFIDYGIPKEFVKCRVCKKDMHRGE